MIELEEEEEEQRYSKNDIIITKIRGEAAEKVLFELENGAGLYFKSTLDNNDNIVIELHRDKKRNNI